MKPRFTITLHDHADGRFMEATIGDDTPGMLALRIRVSLAALWRHMRKSAAITHEENPLRPDAGC